MGLYLQYQPFILEGMHYAGILTTMYIDDKSIEIEKSHIRE